MKTSYRLFGSALRRSLAEGYGASELRADVLAGLVVGMVALPLAMALAIASGVPPQHGLYTTIVAGTLIAGLGGSRVQVSGPTAAFVVILAPIASRFGLGGLCLATMLAGFILLAMGWARLGQWIDFVPYPVTAGFTAGIAVVIGTLQVKDLLGLTTGPLPEHYLERVAVIVSHLPTATWPNMAIGALTLAVLLLWPNQRTRFPGPLAALLLASVAALVLEALVPGSGVQTIASRFSYLSHGVTMPGIPNLPPHLVWPWQLSGPGPDGAPLVLTLGLLRDLVPSAFAIAMLGAIESLLSAVVADGMTGDRHDPDAELMAQGVGNIVAPFFGGIAATGAIARTATNVRSGARSPVAAIVHSVVVLAAVVVFARFLGYVPMAALAGLLIVVAWKMSDAESFVRLARTAPRGDVVVLLVCFGLTVVFDMVISVTAGVLLAAMLFVKRMSDVSGVRPFAEGESHPDLDGPLPRGVVLYDVAGPLFFGAAQKAVNALRKVETRTVRVVILDLEHVPAVDATAVAALRALVERLNQAGIKVILVRVQPGPLDVFARAGWRNRRGQLRIFRTFERGISVARRTAAAWEAELAAGAPAEVSAAPPR
jgi:SulP family sulfate permease